MVTCKEALWIENFPYSVIALKNEHFLYIKFLVLYKNQNNSTNNLKGQELYQGWLIFVSFVT